MVQHQLRVSQLEHGARKPLIQAACCEMETVEVICGIRNEVTVSIRYQSRLKHFGTFRLKV